MKKYSIALILAVLMLSACEKNGENNASDLVGTWTVESSDVSMTVDGVDFVDYLVDFLDLTAEQAQFFADLFEGEAGPTGTITFKDDNTYSATFDGESETGTWSLSSDGKTLTITSTDGGTEYTDNLTVESLTSSRMVLVLPVDSEDVDLDDDGTNETTVDYSMKLILVR